MLEVAWADFCAAMMIPCSLTRQASCKHRPLLHDLAPVVLAEHGYLTFSSVVEHAPSELQKSCFELQLTAELQTEEFVAAN